MHIIIQISLMPQNCQHSWRHIHCQLYSRVDANQGMPSFPHGRTWQLVVIELGKFSILQGHGHWWILHPLVDAVYHTLLGRTNLIQGFINDENKIGRPETDRETGLGVLRQLERCYGRYMNSNTLCKPMHFFKIIKNSYLYFRLESLIGGGGYRECKAFTVLGVERDGEKAVFYV